MKRTLLAAMVAIGAAAGLTAQTPGSAGGQGQTGAKPADQAGGGKSVTMRGCLRAGDQEGTFVLANATASGGGSGAATGAAGGSTGTGAGAGAGTGTSAGAGKGAGTGAAAGTAASGAAAKGQTFRLMGSPSGVNMKDHVGHTAEITGTMGGGRGGAMGAGSGDASARGGTTTGGTAAGGTTAGGTTTGGTTTGGTTAGGQGGSQGAGGARGGGPVLNVTAMKHVSATCQ